MSDKEKQMGESSRPEQQARTQLTDEDRLAEQMRRILTVRQRDLSPPEDEFIDEMLDHMVELGVHMDELSPEHPLYLMWTRFRNAVSNYLSNIKYTPLSK